MGLKSLLKKLKKSNYFIEWSKSNPDNFFSYAFKTIENDKESPWQFGFYHKSTDKMTTFILENNSVEIQEEEEIFKKPDMKVMPIDIKKIKMPFEKILKKAEELQKNEYPKELISKTIAILQNLEEYATIWNITYVTQSFKTLNIKVNPENGKIISHDLESLMSLIKK